MKPSSKSSEMSRVCHFDDIIWSSLSLVEPQLSRSLPNKKCWHGLGTATRYSYFSFLFCRQFMLRMQVLDPFCGLRMECQFTFQSPLSAVLVCPTSALPRGNVETWAVSETAACSSKRFLCWLCRFPAEAAQAGEGVCPGLWAHRTPSQLLHLPSRWEGAAHACCRQGVDDRISGEQGPIWQSRSAQWGRAAHVSVLLAPVGEGQEWLQGSANACCDVPLAGRTGLGFEFAQTIVAICR